MKINWTTTLFIVGTHIAVFTGLIFFCLYGSCSWTMFISTFVLWFITGMSITAGYHRLYAHQSYKAHKAFEWVLLFFGSMTAEGSAYSWAHDHRLHHSFADTEKDPYCVKDGFWHSHLLWMFKRLPRLDKRIVADLERNTLVMHQHNHYLLWMLLSNLVPTLFVGWLTGAYLTSLLFVWGVRMLLCYHCTWCINSLAHLWGARNFSKEQTAVDNYIISMITFGEGYHNYHHTFARDYRNGIRWYHFDPGKWLIWAMSKIGLSSSLARTSQVRIREKIAEERVKQTIGSGL
jgi:stearoyl-CoA desaturase (delta-9 desaturase)